MSSAPTFLALALLCGSAAADEPADIEARLTWGLAYGTQTVQPELGFAAGPRMGAGDAALPHVISFSLRPDEASFRIAGLPVVNPSYRALQTGEAAGTTPAATPWYSHSWVWWTAAAVAATAALAGGGGSISYNDDSSGSGSGNSGRGGIVCGGGNVGDVSINEDECLVPCPGPGENSCVGNGFVARVDLPALERDNGLEWLDAGTGYMGDLIAR